LRLHKQSIASQTEVDVLVGEHPIREGYSRVPERTNWLSASIARRMLHVRVRVRVRLFARGERWLGHGQGDALFPWEKERRPAIGAMLKLPLRGPRDRRRRIARTCARMSPSDIVARALHRDRTR